MRLGFLAVFLLLGEPSAAQGRFYNLVEGWRNNHSVELGPDYMLMGLGLFTPTHHSYVYNYLDDAGFTLDLFNFWVDTVSTTSTRTSSSLALELENKLLIASYIGDTGNPSDFYGTLFEFELPNGPINLIKTYSNDEFEQLYCIESYNDTTLLLGSFLSNQSELRRVRVYKTNIDGEPHWYFDSTCGDMCNSYIQQVLPLSDGGIGVLFYEFDASLPTFEETKRSVLLKLSTDGVEEWRSYLGDWEGHRIDPGGIVEVDGEIIVSYSETHFWEDEFSNQYEPSDSSTVFLANYNLQGVWISEVSLLNEIPNNIDDEPRYHYEVSQMQILADGNLLITGTTGLGAHLLKTTLTGEVLWNREHFYVPYVPDVFEQDNYIYHALPTSDGGFLCTGEYQHYPTMEDPTFEQSAIALKVDEYGCLEPGCHLADGIAEEVIGTLQVYPNPTSGHVQIALRIPGASASLSALRLQLFDPVGREIPTPTFQLEDSSDGQSLHLNIEALPKGLYLLRLMTVDGAYTARILKE